MTDRELLELAAKAAGVCLHPEDQLHRSYGNWGCDTTCMVCKEDPSRARWSPLTDDGDALRLAAWLSMQVDCSIPGHILVAGPRGICVDEPYLELATANQLIATRRAIVRAAAEVGKGSDHA